MKRLLIICMFSVLSLAALAQCDKNVTYHANQVDFTDSAGKNVDTQKGDVAVNVTNKEIVLIHDDNEDDELKGTIKNVVCTWTEAYKSGKMTFDTEFTEKNGNKNDAAVSIEGKDGKLFIQVSFKSKDMVLKIIPDSYDEAK